MPEAKSPNSKTPRPLAALSKRATTGPRSSASTPSPASMSEIDNGRRIEFINVCEDRHNRMLCELGQMIEDDIDVRLICVAGPSSRARPPFANRLRIELFPAASADPHFDRRLLQADKDKVPLGEDGKPDFEAINALDIELFNQNMLDFINGEEVDLPKFDFRRGPPRHRPPAQLGPTEPIIIEGIHALNDKLTTAIPKSPSSRSSSPRKPRSTSMTTIPSLTDLRLIRRIVRDKNFRGAPPKRPRRCGRRSGTANSNGFTAPKKAATMSSTPSAL
jgi:uridine kinase